MQGRPHFQPGVPGPAVPPRPRLRVFNGGLDDAVSRKKKFESAHPQIVISPPGTRCCLWTARRDGAVLATGYQLAALLDRLSMVLSEQPLDGFDHGE